MGDFGQTLGQIVGIIAGLESLRRPGGLSDYMANRLTAQSDPEARAGLVDNPFLGGFYGVSGQRVPTAVDMPAMPGYDSPSAPERRNVWQPNLPPLGPSAQLKGNMQALDFLLKGAQLRKTEQDIQSAADFAKRFPGGAVAGDKGVTGWTVGPRGLQNITYGTPPTATLTEGDIDPRSGKPYPPTTTTTAGGKTVEKITPAKGARTAQDLDAQLKRLDGAVAGFASLFGVEPVRDAQGAIVSVQPAQGVAPGTSPRDILPSASIGGTLAAPVYNPVRQFFGRGLGENASAAFEAAPALMAPIARAGGESSRIANAEEVRLQKAFLNMGAGTQGNFDTKALMFFRHMEALRSAMANGASDDQLKNMNEDFAAQFAALQTPGQVTALTPATNTPAPGAPATTAPEVQQSIDYLRGLGKPKAAARR